MILSGKHLIMRAVSLLLIAVMACIQPMNSLSEKTAYAASSNKLYIGEVKLFIKTDGKKSDAQSWCDSQEANKDDDDTNGFEGSGETIANGAGDVFQWDACYDGEQQGDAHDRKEGMDLQLGDQEDHCDDCDYERNNEW